ncbi:protein ASPARTIC PROTEASE IN GUARD CELL 2-like [Panicum miliaceum]|uniref:Protein ASPARTIC PROTEASE IN GUARD CELL 2-like n=1 Tax=Panicum miliaceum TaxID=4540 RepID=A0A3L6PRG5_PANMI|nr:protein ASPARTIC PROTEASE IN GUARD CELL 2-like [Panicum miliaceum]
MSPPRLPVLVLVLLSTFWAPSTAVRSATLHLARSHSISPDAGAPITAWAASLAAQSAADAARVATLAAGSGKTKKGGRRSFVPIAPGRQILSIPNYVARARLGTPAQTLLVAIDPSNDAAWVPCGGCTGCAASAPSFAPTQSSTFRPVRCGSPECAQVPSPSCPGGAGASCAFNLTYAASTFQALLGQDSLALENGAPASYTFGCLHVVTGSSVPPQGLVGFGRGPLSFLSQTKDVYGSVFSYCLPSYKSSNFSGTLRLGPIGQPKRIKTTPLLSNPHRPSLYYVNMIGIRVGSKPVPVPASALAFDPASGRGTIIDAGTMFTRLSAPVYAAVRDAFRRRVRAPVAGPLGGFDTCYNVTVAVPSISFTFAGPVTVTLPEENVVIRSSSGGVACLAMAAGPADGVNAALNVLASMQQQNHRVLFDVANGRVGFSRELCTV